MIRLLLVDEQGLVCQGLKAMLSLEVDLQVIGTANNGEKAIEQVTTLKPDLVLMDKHIPMIDGRNATQIICQQFPEVKVVVLSTSDKDIADALRAGAKGYLLKDMPVEELVQAIRQVHRGYTQLAPGILEQLIDTDTVDSVFLGEKCDQLTPREIEVLNLIARCHTNREIAQELYIAEGTVKAHVTNILNRLGLRNRSQLAIYAHHSDQI